MSGTLIGWLIPVVYVFLAGTFYGTYQSRAAATCGAANHFGRRWCGHTTTSLWLFGVFWIVGVPFAFGTHFGKLFDLSARRISKQEREIAQARHNVEVARLRKQENDLLDAQIGRISA